MLLYAELYCCIFMTGLIWLIQIVHYPLFKKVGEAAYAEYQLEHMRKITWLVLPVMSLELIFGVLLVIGWLNSGSQLSGSLWIIPLNIVGLFAIWLSTLVFQVPIHASLVKNFSSAKLQRLINTNWLRTILWSLRSFLLLTLAQDLL